MTNRTFEDATDAEIETLRERLEAQLDELQRSLAQSRESSKPVELDQEAVGRVSRVDAIQQQQMAAAHRRRTEIRLQQTKAALQAMERDEYGYCNACDEPLGLKRLEVRPESPVCVTCRSGME